MSEVKEYPEVDIFKTVLYYCLLIIILPLASFFISKIFIFDGLLALSASTSNICSSLVAVVGVHIALGAFIYRAYFSDKIKPASKAD